MQRQDFKDYSDLLGICIFVMSNMRKPLVCEPYMLREPGVNLA